MAQRPVAEGLFKTDPPRLIGARAKADGRITFPMPTGAEAQRFDAIDLATEGTLWSYTVQRFRPKTPPFISDEDDRTFTPFALGYIELAGQVIVESRIVVDDFADLKVGMPMRLDLAPFRIEADGTEVMTYVFKPAEGAQA